MTRALFYVDTVPEVGDLAVVDGDEGFHAANVRRIRAGEELDLGDGAGAMAHCVIEEVGKGRLSARVHDRWTVEPASPLVTVVQAVPKSDRSELAIELATEAGADAFVAWQAARCVARWDGGRADKGLRRWRAVARAAARQSRRPHIPSVTGVATTDELVADVRDALTSGTTVLALHESAEQPLTKLSLAQADSLMLVVGPEGGIADDEIAALSEAGAKPVRSGSDGPANVDRGGRGAGCAGCLDVPVGLTGIIRAMGGTGSVVTAAGLVFALTMCSTVLGDLRVIGQMGTTIGLGLLFDTLVVRSFMTPAIATLLGRWFWWPMNVRSRPPRPTPAPAEVNAG